MKLIRFGVAIPEDLLNKFDEWTGEQGIANRSVALRQIMREKLADWYWQEGVDDVSGSLTLVYDHHSNDITGVLTELQHDYGDVILCTTHVHISHELCLECLIVKGNSARIKELTRVLYGMKGMRSVNAAISASI